MSPIVRQTSISSELNDSETGKGKGKSSKYLRSELASIMLSPAEAADGEKGAEKQGSRNSRSESGIAVCMKSDVMWMLLSEIDLESILKKLAD